MCVHTSSYERELVCQSGSGRCTRLHQQAALVQRDARERAPGPIHNVQVSHALSIPACTHARKRFTPSGQRVGVQARARKRAGSEKLAFFSAFPLPPSPLPSPSFLPLGSPQRVEPDELPLWPLLEEHSEGPPHHDEDAAVRGVAPAEEHLVGLKLDLRGGRGEEGEGERGGEGIVREREKREGVGF